ncbi:MAG: hypothetical protein HQL16_03525 [Candidatus Omnitrophica bacterium]|nr:hypothetical protein [Candidatus Omnitrophota bacterium]
MGVNVMEREKGTLLVTPKKPHDPVVKKPDVLPVPAASPVLDLEAAYGLQYRRLEEEAQAREKKLIAELEAKQDMLLKKMGESFAEKEKKLIEELEAKFMAEYRRLEEAAADKEQSLLEQLGLARRQLFIVVVLAVISIVAVVNFKARPKDAPVPVLPAPVSAEKASAALPASPAVTVLSPAAQAAPEAAPAAAQKAASAPAAQPIVKPAVKAGNGGNFAGGFSSGK